MSLLRSEKMGYYNIVMTHENAWQILNELGKIDSVHFLDMENTIG